MFKKLCPNLVIERNGKVTSPQTTLYNCIAYSVWSELTYIWPDDEEIYAWPPNLPRNRRLETFLSFYNLCGYNACDQDFSFDPNYEKVAVFIGDGEVTHAARQLVCERIWVSKLGDLADIQHSDLAAISCGDYGVPVAAVIRRYDGSAPMLPELHPPLSQLIRPNGLPI